MTLETLQQLLTPAGTAAMAAAADLKPTDVSYPAAFDRLRKRFPAELARAALDQTLLRAKAAGKFADAARMLFTRDAYEMASGDATARHRAERFAPYARVADLCCGLGADTLALAAAGRDVVAIDRDPVMVALTQANLDAAGLPGRATVGDALTCDLAGFDAAFVDPGRRGGGPSGAGRRAVRTAAAGARTPLHCQLPVGGQARAGDSAGRPSPLRARGS